MVIGSHCVGLDYLLGQLQDAAPADQVSGGRIDRRDWRRRGAASAIWPGSICWIPRTDSYNEPFLSPELELIRGYRRMQGIVYRPGDERFEGATVARGDRPCDRGPRGA